MVLGFTLLLVCQLAGEVAVRVLGLPVPGPVLGLVLLGGGLALSHRRAGRAAAFEGRGVVRAADALLANLSLLFVPAGVGVVDQLGALGSQGLALGAAVVASTVLSMLVTVGVFLGVKRLAGVREAAP